MPDKFDPYREALIVETTTVWPPALEMEAADRGRVEQALHSEPSAASQLEYVRLHTGFCRKITVTPADLERLGVGS